MKISVIVRLQIEGTHQWQECNIKEVDFLRNRHRHIFYVECEKQVIDTEREIEIIRLKRQIETHIEKTFGKPAEFGNRSCEMIAVLLAKDFGLLSCQVLEDNENGARVTI